MLQRDVKSEPPLVLETSTNTVVDGLHGGYGGIAGKKNLPWGLGVRI